MKGFTRGEKGFTLVEILIVLAVLAVLAAIVVPNVTGYLGRAKERSWDSDQGQIQLAVQAYYGEESEYPTEGAGGATPTGKPTWDAVDERFDKDKGAIDMSLLVSGDWLDETPESASWSNGGSGSYTWYVDASGDVLSCGPDELDEDFIDGVYP